MQIMDNLASDNGLVVTRWVCDCEVVRFLPDGNARNLHVLFLMLTDGLGP